MKGSLKGQAIAVLTSGGDSQGMNATLRAIVRCGLYAGAKVFFIREGYQGMIDGGANIEEANSLSVSKIIHKGGTIIGSARCNEFRERSGRLKAAKNLVGNGITNLIVIGGDGSLTGANLFKKEWSSLLEELIRKGEIFSIENTKYSCLSVVGIVGSIDNDFCQTDMTIGTDSALHRIIESIDAIVETASSHQRTFILEVMGRHCGYLALVAGLATEADFIFIPECPPEGDWQLKMCEKLSSHRKAGQRLNIVIVSEGSIDRNGNAITAEMIKNIIVENLNQDTRITVLGHVQRGGRPSAFDRVIGCRMGAEAVMTLTEADPEKIPCVICLEGNQLVRRPLIDCVKDTQAIQKVLNERNWEKVVRLRGDRFGPILGTYKMLYGTMPIKPSFEKVQNTSRYTLAVMCVGSPACGMNAAIYSFTRSCIYRGHTVLRVTDGMEGLINDLVEELKWSSVVGWVREGGTFIRTKRTLPDGNYKKIAKTIRKHKINGLLVIGGFDAYISVLQLAEQRKNHLEFRIPMVVIPSTVSNNVPGSDFSVGADTALNEITRICDGIRQSAHGTNRRVFVVETMGGPCGYLATLAGLAGGADQAYIFEEPFSAQEYLRDIERMKNKMRHGVQRGLVLTSGKANVNYNSRFMKELFIHEGDPEFDVRMNVLGHYQQGGSPSPFDRYLGTKMSVKAADWLIKKVIECDQPDANVTSKSPYTAVVLGILERQYSFTPVEELKTEADFENRLPRKQWWLKLRHLLGILASHDEES
ncbi:hypothetical protein QYM36_000768 [Artemia franciscana]|uniref:6-phosphofructokinase n=2 Tax=Artemia franciscana TaxID=6661 RepID=A0AA88ITE7_ARTSF|nr:hypothetical protein QYM36_000768 [Artemia franciscana]